MARSKLEEAREVLENAERGGDASFIVSHLIGWARLMQDHFEHAQPDKSQAASRARARADLPAHSRGRKDG